MERFEQTHRTVLVNDGFNGLNHVRNIPAADFKARAEAPYDTKLGDRRGRCLGGGSASEEAAGVAVAPVRCRD